MISPLDKSTRNVFASLGRKGLYWQRVAAVDTARNKSFPAATLRANILPEKKRIFRCHSFDSSRRSFHIFRKLSCRAVSNCIIKQRLLRKQAAKSRLMILNFFLRLSLLRNPNFVCGYNWIWNAPSSQHLFFFRITFGHYSTYFVTHIITADGNNVVHFLVTVCCIYTTLLSR